MIVEVVHNSTILTRDIRVRNMPQRVNAPPSQTAKLGQQQYCYCHAYRKCTHLPCLLSYDNRHGRCDGHKNARDVAEDGAG